MRPIKMLIRSFPLLSYFFIQVHFYMGVSEGEVAVFPKVFNITDVESCPVGHLYCKLIVKLKPHDEQRPPEIWKAIEKVNRERTNYRRDVIYRGICVERNTLGKEYNEYSSHGLDGLVDASYCFEKKSSENISSHDMYLGMTFACYIAFLVYCIIRTEYSKQSNKNHSEEVNKYIKIFSVTNTWREINKPNRNEDFEKLLSIQGIRTLSTCLVILAHNYVAVIVTFSYNPEYLEQLISHPYTRFIVSSFGLIVQTFFMISAWLLSVQLNNIVRKNGKITIKDVLIVSLNRYFRIIPALILIIFLHSWPIFETIVSQLLYRSYISLEVERCSNRWLKNMFFIQNWGCFEGQICSPGTWYLAVDMQLYLMMLFFFYLSQKFKISINYFLGVAVVIAIYLQGYTVITTTFDGLLQFTPRIMPAETFFHKPEFVYSYTRTECSLVTFVIGFVFGSIYVENKNKDIFNTPMKKISWFTAFLGLPVITTMLYHYRSCRVVEAILAVSLRPLFALGIAIGILGMATNTGGYVKKFFEWRPFVFMASFTYCVYMFHFSIIFLRLSISTRMIYFSNFLYFKNLLQDITFSFLLGTLMYVILEHPCIQLQKMFLPQVKTMKQKSKEKDS